MSKILIVEDEESIADLEKDYLELSGFEVEIENQGDTGLVRAVKEDFDLLILDLMLPEVDGFEICREVREKKDIPIIMVSAKKDDIDKIRGLGLGADDAGGSLKHYLGVGLLGLYHAGLNGHGNGAYGAVAAHVEPSAGIHEEYGKVGLRIDGLADVRAEHVVVAAGLKHQSSAIVVIVLFQPVLALDGGVALGLGEAGVHYTAEFACGMGVDGLEARFEPVKVYLGVVIHDLLSYLLYFNGAKGGAKMKTRVTVKNFAVAEKCFRHAVKEGLMKNLSIPSDYYHSNRCKSQ